MKESIPNQPVTKHPKVFVSYSHDNEMHRQRILGLAERLRTDGFETMIDQYVEGTPPQGWPRWMLNQIDWADYILLVCTETYYRRFRGHEIPEVGKGVDWEGAVITNELYDKKSVSRRFVPVLFANEDLGHIPEPVRSASYHILTSEEAYGRLTDYLAGAAGIQPAELGPPPESKRKTGLSLHFDKSADEKRINSTPVCVVPDFASVRAPGGTMPAGDTFYIERDADRIAKAAAERSGETVVIRGPHQFGKSSLLAQYLALCRKNGKVVASVDFSMFEKSTISDYSRFLGALGLQLARRLRISCPIGEFKTQQEFLEFLELNLLQVVS